MTRGILWLLLLGATLPAQVIRLANHAPRPFAGWVATTTDWPLDDGASGEWEDGSRYVAGILLGQGLRMVHVRATLQPGQRREIDLRKASPRPHKHLPPAGPEWTGGPLRANGTQVQWVSLRLDGPSWLGHLRARVGRMMHLGVWLRHYPGEPFARGEIAWTASNPAVADLETVAPDLALSLGHAIIVVPGRPILAPAVDSAPFADGQARATPFLAVWPRHATTVDYDSAAALASHAVGAVGVSRLLLEGDPLYPDGYDGLAWARQRLPGATAALHGWGPPVAGIAPTSTQTGSQEDQLFVRGESLLPGAVGAEQVAYLCALKFANRPCHHLEANGDPIRLEDHPALGYWHSRPDPRWSADMLGKPRPLAQWDFPGGWYGPDREHWLIGTLTAGYRLTGSPALQWLIEHQARAFMLQETVDPRLPTSHSDAARSVGYAGIVAVRLHRHLQDRALAARIADRYRGRVAICLAEIGDKPGDVWDPRADARITGDLDGYEHGVMWWQQALGSYGLDLACEHFALPEGRAMALRAADAVLAHAYRFQNGRWVEWDNTGYLDGNPLPDTEMVEGKGAHRTGWFAASWFPCAVATVLRHRPDDEKARAIWAQMIEDTARGSRSWLPPGVSR